MSHPDCAPWPQSLAHLHSSLPSSLSSSSPSPSSPSASPLPTPLTPLSLPPPLTSTSSIRSSLLTFLALQEQRARTYHDWAAAFTAYTRQHDTHAAPPSDADLLAFTDTCTQVTQHFRTLSLQVKLVIAHLQSLPPSSPPSTPPAALAQLLSSVQAEEQAKLRLTVEMQQLTSRWVVERKEPFAREFHEEQSRVRERMGEVVDAINDLLTEIRVEATYKQR